MTVKEINDLLVKTGWRVASMKAVHDSGFNNTDSINIKKGSIELMLTRKWPDSDFIKVKFVERGDLEHFLHYIKFMYSKEQ